MTTAMPGPVGAETPRWIVEAESAGKSREAFKIG
jgi:hypothetical protein